MQFQNKIAKVVRVALVLGVGTTAIAAIPTAFAAENETDDIERISITGSSIKRKDFEGALPVQVISRVDIDRTGVSSVGELVQQIPSMQGFTTASESVGGSGGGSVTASIHDLGEQYTLVLLNGRRLAPRGSGSKIDLNSIPLAAVERVEILTDGASALYGSDAIAGVINFILKDNMQGGQFTAKFSKPQEDGGEEGNFSITGGFGDVDEDGYNVMLSFSHDAKDQLAAVDRYYSKTGMVSFKVGNKDLFFFNGSGNAIPGNARVKYTDAAGKDQVYDFNPYREANGGTCSEFNSPIGAECWFDFTSTIEIIPESERDAFFVNGRLAISDNIEAYSTLSYSDFSMTTRIAPYPTGHVPLPQDSNLYTDYFEPYITDEMKAGLTDIQGRWRALPAGNRTDEWNTKSTHFVLGAEGTIFNEVDFDIGFTHSINDTEAKKVAGWLLSNEFITAVTSGAIDIFAPIGEVTKDDLVGLTYEGNWRTVTTTMTAIDAKYSMPIFDLAGGEAYLGGGFDYRIYKYDQEISQANQDALILFYTAGSEFEFERSTYGSFAELILPFTDELEVTGSLRYDSIGGVDDKANGGTVNGDESDITYKLSAKYDLADTLLLRASYGTGFKAPSMLQLGEPRIDFGVTSGNYSCPLPESDSLAQYCLPGKSQYQVYRQGNPNLSPETSEQYTIGFVFNPIKEFSFTIDYWNVKMEDLVTSVSESQIFANPQRFRELFATKTNLATGEEQLAIINSAVNVGKARYRGIDWNIGFENDLGFGNLNTTINGTHMIERAYTLPVTSDEWVSSLGRFGENNAVTFNDIFQITSVLTSGDFNNTVRVSYRSGYDDQHQTAEDCGVTLGDALGECVDVQLYVDEYIKVDYRLDYTIMAGLAVAAGVNNVFDKTPALSLRSGGAGHQVGFDPRYSDSYGRTFYVSADYRF